MNIDAVYSLFKNVYVNFNKRNNCFYVNSYRPEYSTELKKTQKKEVKCIGKIENSDTGIGKITFNSSFISKHPEIVNFNVLRTGKNKIVIEPVKVEISKEAGAVSSDELLEVRHMKVGASYFILEVFKRSYSGRALKALYDSRKITRTQYEQLLTIIVYACYEGVKHLYRIEYFVRDHIVPFTKNFNKDTVQRLFDVLGSELIVAFYTKKHELMQADLSKSHQMLGDRRYIALDGSNIDVNLDNISNADFGKSKSGNSTPIVNFLSLIDKVTGTVMGHCTYSGHTTDIATLEGSVKQLAYYGCKNYTVIVDRGYWSLYNINVMYNLGHDFIVHAKLSMGTLKTFIKSIINDLSVGNGCQKIELNNEINYCQCHELKWSYYDIKSARKCRKPVYLYAFYNPALASAAKLELEEQVRELNSQFNEYKEALSKATAQHKKKPEMPKLPELFQNLLNEGVLYLNTTYNRYDLDNTKSFSYCQSAGVWILASSRQIECEEIFTRYRQRNEIEVMYRYFKNHVEADTLEVSNEQNFNAKLFLGLLASEFLNTLKLKIIDWNKTATQKAQVKLKDNSMYMTFKDLDTLECIYHKDTIIPTTNILKRHENLFTMMGIDPIVLQNTRLKKASLNEELGLILNN